MVKYREKSTVIEAEVYMPGMEDGFDFYSVTGNFICSLTNEEMNHQGCPRSNRTPFINILGKRHYISAGDYIVTKANGKRYVYKPDTFAAIYEKVESTDDQQDIMRAALGNIILLITNLEEKATVTDSAIMCIAAKALSFSDTKIKAEKTPEDQYTCTDKECYDHGNFRRTCPSCRCYKSIKSNENHGQ